MFLLKKLVAVVVMPFALALLLVLLALVLRLLGKKRGASALAAMGVLLAFLAAWGPAADALLWPLERRYPPVLETSAHLDRQIAAVVVLGASFRPEPGLPITSQLSVDAQTRLIEGIRLHRELSGVPLVLSGGRVLDSPASAEGYRLAALALGMSDEDFVLIDTPRDTGEEAYAARDLLGQGATVLLVTSASHIPRAMYHFERAGLDPIAAPTGHLIVQPDRRGLGYWIPSSGHLRKTERALYEHMGLLAARFEH